MKFTFPPESKPLDGYTIKRAIDRGGFGEVYYALSDAGKEVALKLLNQNLEVELRGVSQCLNLKHPNLVTIFDIRTDADGDHWIVMEYIRGKSLDAVIAENGGPLPREEIERWLTGMAAGLSFLHDRGIVHRDLKPANVYLETGVVKIGDVGLAKFISESKRSAQTQSVGTVYYMAPEVAHGRYGREVDIYSFGVILYEMLTGRVPFDGESTGEILMKHLSEAPDLEPVPEPFRPVLAAALHKDPLRRTPSVAQLQEDFRNAATGGRVPTASQEVPQDIPAEAFRRNEAGWVGPTGNADSSRIGGSQSSSAECADWDQDVRDYARRIRKQVAQDVRQAVAQGKQAVKQAKKAAKEERKRHKKAAKYEYKTAKRYGPPVGTRAAVAGRPENGSRPPAQAVPHDDYGHPAAPHNPGDPVRPNHRSEGESKRSAVADRLHRLFVVAAVIIVVLALVAPRALPGLMSRVFLAGVYLALAYGVYRVIVYFFQPTAKAPPVPDRGEGSPVPPQPQPVPAPVPAGPPASRPKARHRHAVRLGPETPRVLSLRQRMTELTGSLAVAVLTTAVLTGGLSMLASFLADPARIALFGVTTLLGTWAVLGASKFCEGTSLGRTQRRLMLLLLGSVVGTAAYGLDQTLMVDFQLQDRASVRGGVLSEVRPFPAVLDGYQPTLFGYVVFFAGLFALRRWWRHADGFRKKRFRLISVLLTALLGWGWSLVAGFPILWGVTWAAVISCVVHLSAAWVPTDQRRKLMEGEAHV